MLKWSSSNLTNARLLLLGPLSEALNLKLGYELIEVALDKWKRNVRDLQEHESRVSFDGIDK